MPGEMSIMSLTVRSIVSLQHWGIISLFYHITVNVCKKEEGYFYFNQDDSYFEYKKYQYSVASSCHGAEKGKCKRKSCTQKQ